MTVTKITNNKIISRFDSLRFQIINELFFQKEILGLSDIDILALLAAQQKPVPLKDFCSRAAFLFTYASEQSVRNRVNILESSGYICKTNDLRNKKIYLSEKLKVDNRADILLSYNLLVQDASTKNTK